MFPAFNVKLEFNVTVSASVFYLLFFLLIAPGMTYFAASFQALSFAYGHAGVLG